MAGAAGAAAAALPHPILTAAEQATLDAEKIQAHLRDEEYLQRHPELAAMLQQFLEALMDRKPDNVLDFAVQHFTGTPAPAARGSSAAGGGGGGGGK